MTSRPRRIADRPNGAGRSAPGHRGGLMDALSDVLKAVRLTGAIFFDVQASAPWVAETPRGALVVKRFFPSADHLISYHAVTSGDCWASIAGEPPIRLT